MYRFCIQSLIILSVVFITLASQNCQRAFADNNGKALTIVAVGDIMMGTVYPVDILPPDDGKGMFKPVQGEFQGGDVVFGNLEASLYDDGKPTKCKVPLSGNCFEFVTPSRYSSHLKEAGFSVLNIANNHILDSGLEGAESTKAALRNVGIHPAGGETIAYLDKNGKKIAVVGFSYKASTYAYSILDIPEAQEIAARLKKSHDIVIVSFHGGAEGKHALRIPKGDEIFLKENRGNVVKFAHAVIDAGADMVIGHGPHVLRAMEVYKGKLIAYSLGNFLTYALFNLKGPNCLSVILKARIDSATGNFLDGRLIPVRLVNGGIPEIDPTGDAIRLIMELTVTDIKPPSLVIEGNGIFRPLNTR